ncbi:MAG: NAD(P)H-hydrate dehydratase [Candidatus Omnitrophica bacterium]|nr:NAD(P)H-hydrate dehydratase [Candidatus Omnitrophota bacterium]
MQLPSRLLQRKPDSHKGDFGHIFILAGSRRFSGAAVLCALGAMRAGAGLVTLGIPKSLNSAIIKIKPEEVMTLPLSETKEGTLSSSAYKKISDFIKDIDVLVVGPGLSQNKETQRLARKVIKEIGKPMVIDADGLNALVGHLDLLKGVKVLTPHPGEMARLLGSSIKVVQSQRKKIAEKFARDYKVAVVLKGYNSIVADCKGNLYVNRTGNPGMATAGSGDVLTGMIAAFLGQGLDTFNAAKYAVYIHGLAGDLGAEEKTQISLIASDIIAKIPEAVKECS